MRYRISPKSLQKLWEQVRSRIIIAILPELSRLLPTFVLPDTLDAR
jgi:hypothetical protein